MYIPNHQQTSNVVLLKIAKNHMIFTIDQTSTINMQYCMCFGLPKCNALNNIRVCEWVLLSEWSFLWIFSILSCNRSKTFQDDWIFILFRWNILFWNSNLSNPKSKYTNTFKNLQEIPNLYLRMSKNATAIEYWDDFL